MVFTMSSTSLLFMQRGKASTSPNSLKRTHLPSITGIAASGPMSPRPRTAVPSVTTRQSVTDGTAVLGLGDIGPEAAMPVMEGKAMLFKQLANVDAYPVCVRTSGVEELVAIGKAIAPGFGGINLEDVAAPVCFEVERRLQDELDIPVFHDDQHGTAIVSLAALYGAAEVVGKKMEDLNVVFLGMGAAGVACVKLWQFAGVGNFIGVDRKGIVTPDRTDLNDQTRSIAET